MGAAERDAAEAEPPVRAAAAADAEGSSRAIARLGELGGDALRAFQEAGGRVELIASAATHAVLPKLATRAGRRLQIDAGLRSHRRRFGAPAGFWLPECAYAPGTEAVLAERGISYTCLDLSAGEPDGAALAPVLLPAGLTAFTIDWPTVELVWARDGYPADPAYLEYHRLSANGIRLWSISGQPYDPEAARARATEHARDFLAKVRLRLAEHAERKGGRGLCVFAIDTELLGHWWAEGPSWLAEVIAAAAGEGVRLVTLSEALAEHEPEPRRAPESSWGEGKGLETWDSPAVVDLAWAARRLELRMLSAAARRRAEPGLGRGAPRGPRAAGRAVQRLGVHGSSWPGGGLSLRAGHRSRPGDAGGPWGAAGRQPGLRNLAPDLSLGPLVEP